MTAIGIDTHKATLAACAVDELGRPVGEATFAISMAPRSPAKLRLKPGSTGTNGSSGVNVRPILRETTRFSGEAMQIGRTGLPLARNGHGIARGQGRSSTQTRTPLTTDARTRRDRVGYREEFSFSCTTTRF
jgi:hypothetical protein